MTNCPKPIALFVLILLGLYVGASVSPASENQKSQPKQESKATTASMTGCVDEQNGRYVLTNDRDLALIALLEADGFPTEAFAKHLGHKVTVKGTSIPGEVQPTFRVRSVVAVSDTCAPQNE